MVLNLVSTLPEELREVMGNEAGKALVAAGP